MRSRSDPTAISGSRNSCRIGSCAWASTASSLLPHRRGQHAPRHRFDSQGRLWVTLQGYNQIAQMDQNGNIVATHTIPYPDSNPHGLTLASNGNVWFTGREGNIVGYYDPTTKFPDLPVTQPRPEPQPRAERQLPDLHHSGPRRVDVFHRPADQQRRPDHAFGRS